MGQTSPLPTPNLCVLPGSSLWGSLSSSAGKGKFETLLSSRPLWCAECLVAMATVCRAC